MNDEMHMTIKDTNEPIDCFKVLGPKYEDCETIWGVPDCCSIDDVDDMFAINSNTNSAFENSSGDLTDTGDKVDPADPVDCFKVYGPRFEDCEREWGWDCCFVDYDALFDTGYDPNATLENGPNLNDNLNSNDDDVFTNIPSNNGSGSGNGNGNSWSVESHGQYGGGSTDINVFRWLVLMGLVVYAVISLLTRACGWSWTLPEEQEVVSAVDEDDEDESDEKVELRKLI